MPPRAANPGGSATVTISGTVSAAGRGVPTADALLFDGSLPDTPQVFKVSLRATGGSQYAYEFPLTLSNAPGRPGRSGHGYSVAVSVQDTGGPASTSTSFTLPAALPAPHPAGHPGRPHPSGHAGRA